MAALPNIATEEEGDQGILREEICCQKWGQSNFLHVN